jgi:hypothetical protein
LSDPVYRFIERGKILSQVATPLYLFLRLDGITDLEEREAVEKAWRADIARKDFEASIEPLQKIFGPRLSNLGVTPNQVQDLLGALLDTKPTPMTDAAYIYPWASSSLNLNK